MSALIEVTKDQFFACIGSRNVHPREEPNVSIWETPQRQVLGRTTPGYLGIGRKQYLVLADLLPEPRP